MKKYKYIHFNCKNCGKEKKANSSRLCKNCASNLYSNCRICGVEKTKNTNSKCIKCTREYTYKNSEAPPAIIDVSERIAEFQEQREQFLSIRDNLQNLIDKINRNGGWFDIIDLNEMITYYQMATEDIHEFSFFKTNKQIPKIFKYLKTWIVRMNRKMSPNYKWRSCYGKRSNYHKKSTI